jgi:glutaredoxin-like protein
VIARDPSAAIKAVLDDVASAVRLLFFEQSIGCESCAPTRQLLDQLADMSRHVTVESLNLILDKDRAAEYGADRVPAIIVSAPGRERIRFYGAPLGLELMPLVEAIRMTAAGESGLTAESKAEVAHLAAPASVRVFYTPTCVYCPQMVMLANRFATESARITATAVDASEYPDLVRKYGVNGVPKTVVNDKVEILGVASETELVRALLKAVE